MPVIEFTCIYSMLISLKNDLHGCHFETIACTETEAPRWLHIPNALHWQRIVDTARLY